ncbi:MAG: glutamate racemase [Thermoleophilia bacterium]
MGSREAKIDPRPSDKVDRRPIGMFDSGVGGLTVLHECLVSFPQEDFIYLGDTGRFPYGPRSIEELRSFAWQIASHLLSLDVKLLVVACNSATAAALTFLQEQLEASIIGAVHPEAEAAVQTTRNRKVGVLATEATVASGSYERALLNLDAGLETFSQACPQLASMIQSGDVSSPEMVEAVKGYAAPLKDAGVDTVILGCTHYPLVTPMLQRVFGRDVTLVNSAQEIAREVGEVLDRKCIGNAPEREGRYSFLCTGDVESFVEVGARFLQMPFENVKHVEISELEKIEVG